MKYIVGINDFDAVFVDVRCKKYEYVVKNKEDIQHVFNELNCILERLWQAEAYDEWN